MKTFLIIALLFSTQSFAQTTTTTGEKLLMGKKGSSTNVRIQANTNSANKPELQYDKTASKWKMTHDGTTYYDVSSDGGGAVAISASNIDWSLGNVYTKTLAANTTFTFSNLKVGAIIVRVTNTASNYTVTWPASAKWSGGTAPTQTIGAKADVYTLVYDGTTVFGSAVQDFTP